MTVHIAVNSPRAAGSVLSPAFRLTLARLPLLFAGFQPILQVETTIICKDMEQQEKFEKITIDLRPFGWGIRDVDVIWPEGHEGGVPGPDSVGSEEIADGSIQMVDLADDVKDEMLTDDDRVTQDELNGFDV